jgi:FkbM family methyltransferase
MLIPLHTLIQKYNIKFEGILHVGAHECEELPEYEKYLSRDKIVWVEALPDKVQLCKDRYPGIHIENAIVSDVIEKVVFKVSNNGQSSSILEFGLHSQYHPHVHYVMAFEGETTLLKDILPKYNIKYNFLNFDIQGAELKALKGMEEYLSNVDYLYTEVNSDYVYKNCALVTELDEYLAKFGLIRVETNWTDCKWGDAFYIKNSLINA